jgi:hypothetical protein
LLGECSTAWAIPLSFFVFRSLVFSSVSCIFIKFILTGIFVYIYETR